MISIILPTYNPGPSVVSTWHTVRQFVENCHSPWEVLFVCDGCTDGTDERLADLSDVAPIAGARIISYSQNRGKGYAVRLGLESAQGQWRLFTDSDLAYSFTDILEVATKLRQGAPVVVANRSHPDSRIQLAPSSLGYYYRRQIQSGAFNWLARQLLPIQQRDTQAGLKGMSAQVAKLILPRMQCNGFGFDCELLTACARYNIPIQDVPVCVQYDDTASSTGGFRTMWRMFRELWSIRQSWAKLPPQTETAIPAILTIPQNRAA